MSNAPSRRGHKPRIPSRATTVNMLIDTNDWQNNADTTNFQANGVVPKAPRTLKTSVDSLVEQLKLANQKVVSLGPLVFSSTSAY